MKILIGCIAAGFMGGMMALDGLTWRSTIGIVIYVLTSITIEKSRD